jgi:molecular chaperone DnaK (HSP70)
MDILIGIDFGTTNTVITYFSDNKAKVLSDGIFKIIPSKIGKQDNKYYCGNYIPTGCKDIIHSFKLIENNQEYLIIFFNHLYDLITKILGNHKIKAVITVPSNFNDTQREIIKQSFNSVNINVYRMINEPSSAALAYGLYNNNEENILVIDTGGGTMDFTILKKDESFFEVITSNGLNDLGGNNFTQVILDDIIRTKGLKPSNTLWRQAQQIKEKLSYLDDYEIKSIDYCLTKYKFENLAQKLIRQIEQIIKELVNNEINIVILVGGSSRIPMLQDTIKKLVNKPCWVHPNLEYVVAEGAGLYAGIIDNKYTLDNDILILDALPLSLGVELVDGTFSVILPKDSIVPNRRSQKYTTDSPADSTIKIKVYQGERKIANKNFLIGEIIFDKVSLGGVPIIEVTFSVDLNSIITVTINDRKSGFEKNVILKNIPKLNETEINKIIEQSNQLNDIDNEELIRTQNIYLIKTFIENSLINLKINDLIENKNVILEKFKSIEDGIEEMNSLQLIETLNFLQNEYGLLGQPEYNDDNTLDTSEELFLNERKQELKNKILILLAKNPDYEEYLQPVLEQLTYNNTKLDYINEKLNLLNEIEDTKVINYKQEVINLCQYLKSEIENGTLELNLDKIDILTDIINEILINQNNINDWEDQLNILNKKCEDLNR